MTKKIISDFEIMKIPAKDCKEPLVSLRDYSKEIIIDIDRTSKKYEKLRKEECYVRETVAIMLSQAQSLLPEGYKLKIIDGFRSLATQKKIYNLVFKEILRKNPAWSENSIKKEVDKWVANPSTVPPHSTGGAVDVTLIDDFGNEIDMGSKVNDISPNAETISRAISKGARKNREILNAVMKEVGFINYPLEWWHWCYGDRMWAHYAKKPFALYNGITNGKF